MRNGGRVGYQRYGCTAAACAAACTCWQHRCNTGPPHCMTLSATRPPTHLLVLCRALPPVMGRLRLVEASAVGCRPAR